MSNSAPRYAIRCEIPVYNDFDYVDRVDTVVHCMCCTEAWALKKAQRLNAIYDDYSYRVLDTVRDIYVDMPCVSTMLHYEDDGLPF